MKKAFVFTAQVIAGLALLDAFVLVLGIAQVASGEASGYWSPFWMEQARFVIGLIS